MSFGDFTEWKLNKNTHPRVVLRRLKINQNQTDTAINNETDQNCDEECPEPSSNSNYTNEEIRTELKKIVSDCDSDCELCCALIRQLSAHVAENHFNNEKIKKTRKRKRNENELLESTVSPFFPTPGETNANTVEEDVKSRISLIVTGGSSPNKNFSVTLTKLKIEIPDKEIQNGGQEISPEFKIANARRTSVRIRKPVRYADNDEDTIINDITNEHQVPITTTDPNLDLSQDQGFDDVDENTGKVARKRKNPDKPKSLKKKRSKNRRYSLLSPTKQFKCLNKTDLDLECGKSFSTVEELNLYLRTEHGGEGPYEMTLNQTSCPYNCQYCHKGFNSSILYERHFRDPDHKGKYPYNCETCGKGYLLVKYYFLHVKENHRKQADAEESESTEIEGNMMCGICQSVFFTVEEITNHVRQTHGNTKLHECHVCQIKFRLKEMLPHFELFHPGQLPFACKINPGECTMEFSMPMELEIHERKIHNTKPLFTCEKCNKVFTTKYKLNFHGQVHAEGAKPHRCDICGSLFSTLAERDIHKAVHVPTKAYVCEIDECWQGFSTKDILDAHVIKVHSGETSEKEKNSDSDSDTETVEENLNSCADAEDKMLNSNSEKQVKPYGCRICKKSYKNSRQLTNHIRKKHGKTNNKTFQCYICEMKFRIQSQHNQHMRETHPNDKPFGCDICGNTFCQKGSLIEHMMGHTGEKPLKCSSCNYTTANRSHLKTHQRIHTGERPYKCDLCSKSFIQMDHLKNHKLLVHEGEKSFMCDECGKSFGAKYSLKIHSITHKTTADGAKLKPHGCKNCDARFALRGQLTTHALIHSGLKPHMCEECGTRFRLPHQMRAHLKTHK